VAFRASLEPVPAGFRRDLACPVEDALAHQLGGFPCQFDGSGVDRFRLVGWRSSHSPGTISDGSLRCQPSRGGVIHQLVCELSGSLRTLGSPPSQKRAKLTGSRAEEARARLAQGETHMRCALRPD
jgi:hypothetical protein